MPGARANAAPHEAYPADPADVANLKRQRGQEAILQSIEGTGIALVGSVGFGLAAHCVGKKALSRFKETEAALKEANATQES